MPASPLGVPWNAGFAWQYVNYTTGRCRRRMLRCGSAGTLSAKKWFTGPKNTIEIVAEPTRRSARSLRAADGRSPSGRSTAVYDKILVAIDDSAQSERASEAAIGWPSCRVAPCS